jgi:hypothetical protein
MMSHPLPPGQGFEADSNGGTRIDRTVGFDWLSVIGEPPIHEPLVTRRECVLSLIEWAFDPNTRAAAAGTRLAVLGAALGAAPYAFMPVRDLARRLGRSERTIKRAFRTVRRPT